LNRGTKPFKQWRGALGTKHLSSFNDLKKVFTGGVPTWPHQVDMYQLQRRFVANECKDLSIPRKLQDHISSFLFFSITSCVSKPPIKTICCNHISLWTSSNHCVPIELRLDSGRLCQSYLLRSGCDRDLNLSTQRLI
jgi:hypothetical protein